MGGWESTADAAPTAPMASPHLVLPRRCPTTRPSARATGRPSCGPTTWCLPPRPSSWATPSRFTPLVGARALGVRFSPPHTQRVLCGPGRVRQHSTERGGAAALLPLLPPVPPPPRLPNRATLLRCNSSPPLPCRVAAPPLAPLHGPHVHSPRKHESNPSPPLAPLHGPHVHSPHKHERNPSPPLPALAPSAGRTRIRLKTTGEVFSLVPPTSKANNVILGG